MRYATLHHRTDQPARRFATAVLLGALLLIATSLAYAQISPEEHQKHHPGQTQSPAADSSGKSMQLGPPSGMGPSGGMGEMMKKMGAPAPKDLYPSLMNMSELTPQQREEIQRQADERVQSGIVALGAALDALSAASAREDYAAMHEATSQVSAALSRFESGVAARRALAEGKAPRNVALQWFKREMNLLPPVASDHGTGVFGMSWFHFFFMLILIGFALSMLAMYFFKMRRATELLTRLTTGKAGATATTAPRTSSARDSDTSPVIASSQPAAAVVAPVVTASKKWTGKLRVSRIFQETPDVNTIRLVDPEGGDLPFSYLPGQFLILTVTPDKKPVKRSYTIASTPTQRHYCEITVKREAQGKVSGYLHEHLKESDVLDVVAPQGKFTFSGSEAESIVLIGGGVGVTPLMSVVRYLADIGWTKDIYLLLSYRNPTDFIFRQELEALRQRHANLHLTVTMTRGDDGQWNGPKGRLSKELIAQSVPDIVTRRVHVCGPDAMMQSVVGMLKELGVPDAQVKREAFGPGKKQTATPAATPDEPKSDQGGNEPPAPKGATTQTATVTFKKSGKSAAMSPDQCVLEAAESIGVDIDNSCRVGTCGTCKVNLLAGSVTMEVEDSLEPEEKDQGVILACQAKSTADLVVDV